ncbi:amidase domain-containing protein [Anoxybacillus sp. TBDG-1]
MRNVVLTFLSLFALFFTFSPSNALAYDSISEQEKNKIVQEALKIIEKRYTSLLPQNSEENVEIQIKNTKSQLRLENIIKRDQDYINKLGASYKKIEILNVDDIQINQVNETIKLSLKVEVAKYYQYKNKKQMEEHPWLETRTHEFIFTSSENKRSKLYALVDYKFEDEMDYTSEQASNSNLPPIEEMNRQQVIEATNDISIMSTQHLYNRSGARSYAYNWYNKNNPDFRVFSNNCTNFISQAINRGGGVNMDWWGDLRWWYQGNQNTTSWSVAHDYVYYARRNNDAGGLGAYYISNVKDLKIGSLVGYDLNNDGYFDHLSIVVNYDSNGEPLTAQHTPSDYNRPWKSVNPSAKHYFIQTNDYWYSN